MVNQPPVEGTPAENAQARRAGGPATDMGKRPTAAERFRDLDAIAVRAQAVRDPAALFPAVGEALLALGLKCYIAEWDAEAAEVVIRYISLRPALHRAAEGLLGRRIEGLRLSVDRVLSLSTALSTGRAIYLGDPQDQIATAIPWVPRPAVRQIMRLLAIRQVIVAPLLTTGTALGVLVVLGRDLADDDVPYMASLATHVGEALAAARTLEAARRRESAAVALGELSAHIAAGAGAAELPALAVRALRQPLGAAAAAVWLLAEASSPEGGDAPVLRLVAHEGVPPNSLSLIAAIPLSANRLVARAAREGRTLAVRTVDEEDDLAESRAALASGGFGLAISAPLRAGGRILGVLGLTFADARPAPAEERAFVEAVTTQLAASLEAARAYASAEEGRRRLAATFDSMVDAVYLLDADGRVVDVNEAGCRLLGVPAREAALRPIVEYVDVVDLLHPDGRPLGADDLVGPRAVRGETVVGVEQIVRNRDTGEERHVIVNAAPIRDEDGAIAGAVMLAHDVTAQRAAERAKDEFLNVASHELKTPLTPIKGFVQIIADMVTRADETPLDRERLQRYLRTLEGRVNRLITLVDEMLDFSRLQRGPFPLNLAPLDLASLAAEVLASFEPAVGGPSRVRHELVLEAPAPVVARGDVSRIDQVLTNLVANALKYSPEGGTVRVRVGQEGDWAVLVVEDEGIGIPAGEEERLFQPFTRGSNAPSLQYTGVGLGLYISREIVNQHGGQITAAPRDATGARPGTSVRVTLPLASG